MPNRTHHPDPSRADRRRLTDLLARAVQAVELLAETTSRERLERSPSASTVILVRHLGIDHLGCWIVLRGRPARAGAALAAEPTLEHVGGRLIGYRGGDLGTGHSHPQRVLVLQQGSAIAEYKTRVDDPVDVAPREW